MELSDCVYLGIDYDGGVVGEDEQLKHMSPRSLMDVARNLKFPKLFFTDLGRSSKTGPLQSGIIKSLASGPIPVYVGGGIQEADLDRLVELGAKGALLSVVSIVTEAK